MSWRHGLPLALLNTSIITADGVFTHTTIDAGRANDIAWYHRNTGTVVSYIGHQATAELVTAALGFPVEVNRVPFEQQIGQEALVFKLNGRAAEGRILTLGEIEAVGFTWKYLVRSA